jgi:hypothetical protein
LKEDIDMEAKTLAERIGLLDENIQKDIAHGNPPISELMLAHCGVLAILSSMAQRLEAIEPPDEANPPIHSNESTGNALELETISILAERLEDEMRERYTKNVIPTIQPEKPVEWMTPGQALDWMFENYEKHLVDDSGVDWVLCSDTIAPFQPVTFMSSRDGSFKATPLTVMQSRKFRRPNRTAHQLPKLPGGYTWGKNRVINGTPNNGSTHCRTCETQTERDICAACVQEFDTRPKI